MVEVVCGVITFRKKIRRSVGKAVAVTSAGSGALLLLASVPLPPLTDLDKAHNSLGLSSMEVIITVISK